VGLAVAVAVGGACSSGDDDDDDTIAPLAWGPCDDPMGLPGECARFEVPVDWEDPGGAVLTREVLRIPARDPRTRVGALVLDFGGPGLETRALVAVSYPDSLLPGSGVLADHFDWLVLEWRGAGTPRVNCMDGDASDLVALVAASPDEPRTPDEWGAVATAARALQASCLEEYGAPLLSHLDADSAAHDLEELRQRMGEPQLDMVAFSYGTVLAATYAARYPDHVRAFALDSPLALGLDLRAFSIGQAVALEEALGRFFAWCAGAGGGECPFAADTADDTAARWDALHAALEAAPLAAGDRTIDGGRMLFAAVSALYFPAWNRRPLADALVAAEAGDGGPLAGLYEAGLLDPSMISSLVAILGADMPAAGDLAPETLEAMFAGEVQGLAPRMGALSVAGNAWSVDWPAPRATARPVGPIAAPPLLVTSSLHDVGTNHAWAQTLVGELGNDSILLTAPFDGHVNGRWQPCLADEIVGFLMDPGSRPAEDACAR